MDQLSEKMKERLERWRKNILVVSPIPKPNGVKNIRMSAKGDYGDIATLAEWEAEERKAGDRYGKRFS